MKRPNLVSPWLVAAWPGVGVVGLSALTYLARRLRARPVGELGVPRSFAARGAMATEGLLEPSRRPRATLFAWEGRASGARDLVLLLGESAPIDQGWGFAQATIAMTEDLGIERVVTLGGLPAPIDPRAESRVHVAATDPASLARALEAGAEGLDGHPIEGLTGLLVGAAKERGIPGLCLLGELPGFARTFPNPKASAAVLRTLVRLAGLSLDLQDVEAEAARVEEVLAELFDDWSDEPDDGTLRRAQWLEARRRIQELRSTQRIEELFAAAREDRARALELKAELDRLGLFGAYEDRFLDLFEPRPGAEP